MIVDNRKLSGYRTEKIMLISDVDQYSFDEKTEKEIIRKKKSTNGYFRKWFVENKNHNRLKPILILYINKLYNFKGNRYFLIIRDNIIYESCLRENLLASYSFWVTIIYVHFFPYYFVIYYLPFIHLNLYPCYF